MRCLRFRDVGYNDAVFAIGTEVLGNFLLIVCGLLCSGNFDDDGFFGRIHLEKLRNQSLFPENDLDCLIKVTNTYRHN